MEEIESIFHRNIEKASSNDLINWRKELPIVNTLYEKIRDNYKQCLETPLKDSQILMSVRTIGERYTNLNKQKYINKLIFEINARELDKHAEFKRSKLNIKLEKFSGYDTSIDFYTFRSNFEKMHSSSTPTELLPDLLRNNYLADPAFTMVKTLKSIDIIWDRLREAFGDTHVMLTRKLQQKPWFQPKRPWEVNCCHQ